MKLSYILAVLGFCICTSAAQAARVETVFDFTAASDSSATGGTSLDYTVGGDTLTVRSYRFKQRLFSTGFEDATVSQSSSVGLGVGGGLSDSFVDGGSIVFASHTEFLVLQMPTLAWQPEEIVFSLPLGSLLGDYTVFGTNADISTLSGFATAASTSDYDVLYASTLSGVANPLEFTNAGEYANIVIAAAVLDDDGLPLVSLNKFGVKSFTGSTSVVPVPAALPLLATALAFFGFVRARRNLPA